MAARHKKGKASGGAIKKNSGNPYVFEEAEKRKSGGRTMGKISGGASRLRLDRPGRKSGGRVGADKSPLSSANKTSSAETAPKSQVGGASD